MLIDFQAFFALMPGDELDLAVRQASSGKVCDHLMAKEMRVHRLHDPRLVAIVLDDLLHTAGRKRSVPSRLEEITILGVGAEVALEHQAKAGRKEDIALLPALALSDKDFAVHKVDISNFDFDQLTDPDR